MTESKSRPGPEGWWGIDYKGMWESILEDALYFIVLVVTWDVHLSECIDVYSEMHALLLYANDTSMKLLFQRLQEEEAGGTE